MIQQRIFLTLLAVFILALNNSQAQYYQRDKNLSMGLTFSPNIAWLSYEDSDAFHASNQVAASYGLLADIGFARNYYFSTGLFINTMKSQVEAGSTNKDFIPRTYRLQYAEVPLSIKLKSNNTGQNRFYGQFGFTAGVKVSGKEKLDKASKYTAVSGDDIFRLGLIIGTGMEWRIANGLSAITGIAYNNGFTRTLKQGSPTLSHVSFNLGLLF